MRPMSFITVLAGAVLVQTGTSQDRHVTTASLTVVTPVGVVSACQGFSCNALSIKAGNGDIIEAYAFGPSGGTYALFAGFPVDMCQPLAGFTNNLAIWPIPVVLGVGLLPDGHPYHDPITCGNLVAVRYTTTFPGWIVPGDTIRLQAMAFEPNAGYGPTFSRAVDVTCN